jgi:hypothetical protein
MIDWHSERFKKFAVWVMAALAVLFLVTSLSSGDFFTLLHNIGSFLGIVSSTGGGEIKALGTAVDPNEYRSFVARWKMVIAIEYGHNFEAPDEYVSNYFSRYKEAEKMGIMVSDKRITEAIQSNQLFMSPVSLQGQQYVFDDIKYKQYLSLFNNAGVSEGGYRQLVKEELMIQQLETMYTGWGLDGPGRFVRRLSIFEGGLPEFLPVMAWRLPGNEPIDLVALARDYVEKNERRKVIYIKASIYSFMESARAEIKRQGGDVVSEDDLAKFYDLASRYTPPRKVSGDYLYIIAPKLIEEMQKRGLVKKEEIEAGIREEVKMMKDEDVRDFYFANRDKMYRKSGLEEATRAVEPLRTSIPRAQSAPEAAPAPEPAPPEGTTAPGAGSPIADNETTGEPPASPPTAGTPVRLPAPAIAKPKPATGLKLENYLNPRLDEIREDIIKQRVGKAVRQQSLEAFYKQLQDYINQFNAVNTREIADAVFQGVSMGNFFDKMGAFLKLSLAEARRREGAADLKAFAERFPGAVEYGTVAAPFSKDTAEKVPVIGGKDLARVPVELFVKDVKGVNFASQEAAPSADRLVYPGGVSGFLAPGEGDNRFVFRITNAEEGVKPEFASLSAERKREITDDCVMERVKEEAYKELLNHQTANEADMVGQNGNPPTYDFQKDIDVLQKDAQAYIDGLKAQGKPAPELPKREETPYFDRKTTEIKGIPEDDLVGFIPAAFELAPGKKPAALADAIRKDAPATIEIDKVYFYVIRLADDKPILRPSRAQFEENKMALLVPLLLPQGMINYYEMLQKRMEQADANLQITGEKKKEGP